VQLREERKRAVLRRIAQGTGKEPVAFTITNKEQVVLCACRRTKKPPFCDGTHGAIVEGTYDVSIQEVAMFKKLIQTNDDVALLVLRILLGVVFIPHGCRRSSASAGPCRCSRPISTSLGIRVPGDHGRISRSWGLITGLFTRVAAFGIAVNMLVAVYMLHWQNGFFMNWFGTRGRGL